MSSRASRASARKISTSISKIAVDDLADSDEETTDVDATLVVDDEKYEVGDKEDEQEEEESSQENNDDEEEFDGESEGGSDEHSGGSDDEDEVIVVPAKRKYKSSKTAVSDDEVVAKKRKTKSQTAEEPPREIEYKVLLFTAAQMKLKKSTRGAPVTEIVTLKSNETWPALRTYILAKINSTLKPAQLLFSNYTVTFTVPRQVSDPIHLNDEDKYEYLVKKALLIVKNPNAKIMVEPKIEQKENEMHVDETDAASKPKSGGKKTKARDILPANVAMNEKIGELRERWTCPAAGGTCGSAHCFFTPAQPEHLPLSHDHFQSWASMMLKGAAFADIETPPNNKLFDGVAAGARAAKSPLLQRRLEVQNEAAAKNIPAAPQININFPAELANLLRPPAPPAPIPAPLLAPPPAFIPPPNSGNMLIPAPRIPGPELSIADFCSVYKLDEAITERLNDNGYKSSNSFQFVEIDDLKDMGFLRGQIAELKVAIGKWSILP